ncbi:DUF2637 domain-containing protein [Actinomadura sp. 6N118]|uniref:DUF2637 domain-containing protein n=1 Tax=Actinomadura sp. 6N118 TaxID=3375151 RepID=UPI0037B80321
MPSDRSTTALRRLLTVSAGLVVVVLLGGAFVLTYDVLRELAVAGKASKRWAPVYPVMVDALVVMTILSLVVSRQARWWSRWIRWVLLLVLLSGAAAIGVQHSLWGYESLPDEPVKAGIAVAPHAMLIISVWLWLTMFKQVRTSTASGPTASPEQPDHPERPEHFEHPVNEPAVPETTHAVPETTHAVPDLIPFPETAPAPQPQPHPEREPEPTYETEPDERVPEPQSRPQPQPPRFHTPTHIPEPDPEPVTRPDAHDEDLQETSPRPPVPALLATDVELVRTRPRDEPSSANLAKTTRPDIVVPPALDAAEDEAEFPVMDRAEDPDAGDDDPVTPTSRELWAGGPPEPPPIPEPIPEPESEPESEPEDASEDAPAPAHTPTSTPTPETSLTSDTPPTADTPASTAKSPTTTKASLASTPPATSKAEEEAKDDEDEDDNDDKDGDPRIWDWHPPSSRFRSSPTPPAD